jgi:hypothetical protein
MTRHLGSQQSKERKCKRVSGLPMQGHGGGDRTFDQTSITLQSRRPARPLVEAHFQWKVKAAALPKTWRVTTNEVLQQQL